jgi:predicted transposase YbfD/YdcC
VLGHLMVAEKSNEIPAAPELIEGLGLKGCVFIDFGADPFGRFVCR